MARHVTFHGPRHGTAQLTPHGAAQRGAWHGTACYGTADGTRTAARHSAWHGTAHCMVLHRIASHGRRHGTARPQHTARHGNEAAIKRRKNEQGRCRADTVQPVSRLHRAGPLGHAANDMKSHSGQRLGFNVRACKQRSAPHPGRQSVMSMPTSGRKCAASEFRTSPCAEFGGRARQNNNLVARQIGQGDPTSPTSPVGVKARGHCAS